MKAPVIRRRTLGERISYLQGHLSALRMCFHLEDLPEAVKKRLGAHIEFEGVELSRAIAERDT